MFDGLYHPFMVIRGMVYYCYTNITEFTFTLVSGQLCARSAYLAKGASLKAPGKLGEQNYLWKALGWVIQPSLEKMSHWG